MKKTCSKEKMERVKQNCFFKRKIIIFEEKKKKRKEFWRSMLKTLKKKKKKEAEEVFERKEFKRVLEIKKLRKS